MIIMMYHDDISLLIYCLSLSLVNIILWMIVIMFARKIRTLPKSHWHGFVVDNHLGLVRIFSIHKPQEEVQTFWISSKYIEFFKICSHGRFNPRWCLIIANSHSRPLADWFRTIEQKLKPKLQTESVAGNDLNYPFHLDPLGYLPASARITN